MAFQGLLISLSSCFNSTYFIVAVIIDKIIVTITTAKTFNFFYLSYLFFDQLIDCFHYIVKVDDQIAINGKIITTAITAVTTTITSLFDIIAYLFLATTTMIITNVFRIYYQYYFKVAEFFDNFNFFLGYFQIENHLILHLIYLNHHCYCLLLLRCCCHPLLNHLLLYHLFIFVLYIFFLASHLINLNFNRYLLISFNLNWLVSSVLH